MIVSNTKIKQNTSINNNINGIHQEDFINKTFVIPNNKSDDKDNATAKMMLAEMNKLDSTNIE